MVTWIPEAFKIESQITTLGISFTPVSNNETEIDMVTPSITEDMDQFFLDKN